MPDPRQAAALEQQANQAIAAQPQPLPMLLASQPGITKDGTRFQHQTYIDGKWVRFWQDHPRKMLGYREQVRNVNGVARNINIFCNGDAGDGGFAYVHLGTTEAFQRYAISLNSGANTGIIDRTPSGYAPSDDNIWQSDVIFETSGGTSMIFAVPLPTLNDITADVESQVYYGDVLLADPLIPAVNVIDASTDGIAFSQTLVGPGNLVLNVNAPIPIGAGNVTITTDADLTAVNATITGTDTAGAPLVVGPFALPNNATYDTGSQFDTVDQVALTAGTGADHVSVGWLAGSQNLTTAGGLVAVGPYLFLYGHDGFIGWNVPGHPLDRTGAGAGTSRPVADKIVRGFPLRGQAAPAALFWSLSSLIVANFVGGTTFWNFSTISTSGSILSAASVVEHNGVYYWATTSGFSQFSGVQQDIPNEYNQQYFLDNLNYAQRQKVFAYKVPRWREIWWCFPFGTSTECNHAVIYDYDKRFWYDTPLPNGGRGAGYYDVTFAFPIMSGVDANSDTDGGTSMWQHEFGLDEVSGPVPTAKAIQSFIETHEFNMLASTPGQLGQNNALAFSTLEPDFNQAGPLTVEVFSRNNPRQTTFQSPTDDPNYPYVIQEPVTDEEDQNVDVKWTGRLTSWLIESNTAGGDFVWGIPQLHMKPSDSRRIG